MYNKLKIKTQKGFAPIFIILTVLLVSVVILLTPIPYYQTQVVCKDDSKCPGPGIWFMPSIWQQLTTNITSSPAETPASPTPVADETPKWKIYKAKYVGVTVHHPTNWIIYSESEGADLGETERVNKNIVLKDLTNNRSLSIVQNFFGDGPSGVEVIREDEILIGSDKIKRTYYAWDSKEDINMIFGFEIDKRRYDILGSWKSNDNQAQIEVDKIITTSEFK